MKCDCALLATEKDFGNQNLYMVEKVTGQRLVKVKKDLEASKTLRF